MISARTALFRRALHTTSRLRAAGQSQYGMKGGDESAGSSTTAGGKTHVVSGPVEGDKPFGVPSGVYSSGEPSQKGDATKASSSLPRSSSSASPAHPTASKQAQNDELSERNSSPSEEAGNLRRDEATKRLFANPIEKRASTSDKATIGYATLNGGTSGGGTATPVTVTTFSALKAALAASGNKVVIISGTIAGNEVVKVPANTSILGKSGAALSGVGLYVLEASNVIIRNLKISKVLADAGDAIGIQSSNRVWVDSVELSSDRDHDKDYYDGLLDITHGSYAISITNSYLHDHWKASLVGHSDSNGAEDVALQVTYAYN
ncbi:hypothetical protein FRC07_003105, partial [Ceratobasidium sp. 392]